MQQKATATANEDEGNLEAALQQLGSASRATDRFSVRDALEALQERSFGPLLLLPGLVVLAPLIGDIPGVPTLMGLIVLLVAGQLLLGHRRLWLPGWLLDRAVEGDKASRALEWMAPAARFFDRVSHPRLTVLTRGPGTAAIALACILVALVLPPMELVPFSANAAGIVLTLLGLALFFRDGLLALIAMGILAASLVLVAQALL